MNLDEVMEFKAAQDAYEGADKGTMEDCGDQCVKMLAESLPALNVTDRAAVAWYIAQLLGALSAKPIRTAGDIIADSSIGYGIAATHYLGVRDVKRGDGNA